MTREVARQPYTPVDVVALLALYAGSAAINLLSVRAVSPSLVLMGEEMSVSIRDVLFSINEHAQASVWSTNFGAPVYYWVAGHLDPSYSLFSARRWKAMAMALAPPVAYVAATRRLDCERVAGVLAGAAAALLPGVAMYGWLATENGLEVVAGSVGLLLATSGRRPWPAALLLAGVAVTTYTSGVAWALAIVVVCAVRALRSSRREVVATSLALVGAIVIVVFPRLWWTSGPRRLVAGGGAFDGDVVHNAANLVRQLAMNGSSYYFFGQQPAWGSPVLAGVIAASTVAALIVRPRVMWPWLIVAGVTVALWLPAGNVPGVRRAIALSMVAALVVAVTVDEGAKRIRARWRPVMLAGVAELLLVPLVVSLVGWQNSYLSGRQRLVADFAIAPGPMPATFARWESDLRSGRLTAQEMVVRYDGLRTLAVIWMLADRQGRDTTGLPTPAQIVALIVPDAAHAKG
ncbi:MAG: hypothetical protein M3Z25_17665 [Actinomycetota bacterium]|nr:hypothetical protein [Actinomycetota bacterium]